MAVRYGNQVPTFEVVGDYATSRGPDAVELFANYGVHFYPCQERELELFLARDADGEFASKTIAISKPRQNGKTFTALYYVVWMCLIEGRNVLWTSHEGKAVRRAFKELRKIFEGTPDFACELKHDREGLYRGGGSEGIYLERGGMIEFMTRTNAGARSGTYDIIIVDEAQEMTDEHYDAIKPTTIASESGDPQMIYLGTPPNEKCQGTVFRGYYDKAHNGQAKNIWWMEWAATEIGDPLDVDRWYQCNPAMGYRIRHKVMADVAESARTPEGFAREYLGWWSKVAAAAEPVIAAKDWEACATSNPPKTGKLSYAVKFAADGKTGALAVCLAPDKGVPHVELIALHSTKRGVKWFADWLLARQDKADSMLIDGKARSGALERRLREGGLSKKDVHVASTGELIGACSMFEDAVEDKQLTHYAYGQEVLDDSVTGSFKRKIGNGGGWGFDGDSPLPVEAAALAYWGATAAKEKSSGKKGRIG